MIIAWGVLVLVGFALTIVASSRTVLYASALAQVTRLPPLIVGLTLLAVGTDLPEIANSIVASASDHGDINVGDSVGSAATQATLVLGLLPFLGASLPTPGNRRYATGLFAALGLVLVAVLVADDHLSRLDGAILVAAWMAGTWAAFRIVNRTIDEEVEEVEVDAAVAGFPVLTLVTRTFLGLVVIGVGATLTVLGVIRISEELGVSEFLIGFFALSIGTSMPELVLDFTAIRRGEPALAVGDLLGSSFVDSTLSVGIGPLLFPVAVGGAAIIPAALLAAFALVAITVMLMKIDRHRRPTGVFALSLYALFYVVVL